MPSFISAQTTDTDSIIAHCKQLPRFANDVLLLLIAEHTQLDVPALLAALKQEQIPVVGGIFPGVIYGDEKFEAGMVVDVLPLAAQPTVVHGLETRSFRLNGLPTFGRDERYTALVLVDGLTKNVALFLDRLFGRLRNSVRYIGGGAGSLSFQQKPCVFDSEGMYQDAALVVWLKSKTALGVRHGWQQLRGPYAATQTEGTVVKTFGSQPAFRVYKDIVEMMSKQTLTADNFFSIAKEYPLGIYHPGMDFIVRDPIAFTDDEALVCVGEVPVNSMVYILRGDRKSLVENAHLATTEAMKDNGASHHNLIVDCISRVLYLEDDFSAELRAVRDALTAGAPPPYGMLSLGEIASFKTGRVEFFNKTFVVGSLQDIP